MSTFAVLVATFGGDDWRVLGDRAAESVEGANDVLRLHRETGTVESVRNELAASAKTDWLIFLDADDSLHPEYLTAMRTSAIGHPGNLLTPAILYRTEAREIGPVFNVEKDLSEGNWMVIGTAVPRDLFLSVGGFDDRAEFGGYGDWALWIKCIKAGARITKVPHALYIVRVLADSWLSEPSHRQRALWHYAVGREHFPRIYTPAWLERWG